LDLFAIKKRIWTYLQEGKIKLVKNVILQTT